MTGTAFGHGFEGAPVEPDWPLLQLDEVHKLLVRFPEAGGAEKILTYSPRPFSSASLVATPCGQVFVKRHHRSVRNREELLEEHGLLRHLQARGGRVVSVLADEKGESTVEAGEWTYEVHRKVEGVDLYGSAESWTPFWNTAQAREAGRALAELHRAAEGYASPRRRVRTLSAGFTFFACSNPWPALEEYVVAHPELATYLEPRAWRESTEKLVIPWHRRLTPYLDRLRPLWTHNDFHASNLLWSGECEDARVVSVIDFGLSDRTNAPYDLANAIERNGVQWLALDGEYDNVVHWQQIEALLQGYEEIHPLSAEEAAAVGAILPLVHAEFALSETEYFLRVLRSEEKAALGWEGYFLGHAQWFESGAGQRLLDAMHAWTRGTTRPSRAIATEVLQ